MRLQHRASRVTGDFRGHHTYFRGAFSERFRPGLRRGIALPKADSSFTMKSSYPGGLPLLPCLRGVRARYVDTWSKKGSLTTISSPSRKVRNSRSHYAS